MLSSQVAPSGTFAILVWSLLALVAFAVAGGAVARDARKRGMTRPTAWGFAVFLGLIAGLLVIPGTFARLFPAALVVGLYLAVRE
ncbi:hypothetical protein JCM17823_27900 [Halorubrum gandharaense]